MISLKKLLYLHHIHIDIGIIHLKLFNTQIDLKFEVNERSSETASTGHLFLRINNMRNTGININTKNNILRYKNVSKFVFIY